MNEGDNPARVEELWFPAGSLVFQAENALFRVSSGILAARSPVFKDMLAFPQPPDAEAIDGCPVVRLHDSAADVTCFLKAIFDFSFFEPYPAVTDLSTVVSAVRLSNKYSVDYLRRRALVHLSSRFDTTLSEHDSDERNSLRLSDRNSGQWKLSAIVLAIQTSREVDALWIIPSAFYILATADDEQIQTVMNCFVYEEHAAKLSPGDQILFIQASLQICRSVHHITRFLHPPSTIPACSGGNECPKARLEAISAFQRRLERNPWCSADPLGVCESFGVMKRLKTTCCSTCYESLTEAHAAARQALWDELPEMCGLPPWEELEKMKEQALKT
ncbi:hypothetical protein B0H11DRAFT_782991 [Mycena galericulata]|nr:hypothetical protein B0H11DRAFT_782991 [Mycena galericulata]